MASLSLIHNGVGHPIINPFGKIIIISQNVLKELDRRGYLHRDRKTGLKGMDPYQYGIFVDAERGTDHFYQLGEDCSGPNQVICRCRECLEKMDVNESRLSRMKADEVVSDIIDKRRSANGYQRSYN